MTTVMNQVVCSLCNLKTDEFKQNKHNFERTPEKKLQKKTFSKGFSTHVLRTGKFLFQKLKKHMTSGNYFFQQTAKRKMNFLCSDSIDNSELDESISYDFQLFIQNFKPDNGETYFNLMDKILFYKNCSIEIKKKTFFNDRNISNKHRDYEDYFILNCLTFCE